MRLSTANPPAATSARLRAWSLILALGVGGLGLVLSERPGGLMGGTRAKTPHRAGPAPEPLQVPVLRLDIAFEDYQKLEAARRSALQAGVLLPKDTSWFVPAEIRVNQETVPCRLRLKGDWTDHLAGEKWSVRVHTRGEAHVLGMRRFSLQHPETRHDQAEPVFLNEARQLGVLVPRYLLVRLVVNGKAMGLMALEEHFSSELLQAQGRLDSEIVAFDERYLWEAEDGSKRGYGGSFDSYRNAPVKVFREGRLAGDPRRAAQARLAAGLLRSFAQGTLPPGDVFDVERLGAFLALAQLWGATHAVRWHNLRFALDPIAARLEPIVFDASLIVHRGQLNRVEAQAEIVSALLADPDVRAAYRRHAERLVKQVADGSLAARVEASEGPWLAALREEFPEVEPLDMTAITRRAALLTFQGDAEPRTPAPYPVLVHVRRHERLGTPPLLELAAAVPHPVDVVQLRWDRPAGGSIPLELTRPLALPQRLAGLQRGASPRWLRLSYRPPPPLPEGSWRLHVVAQLAGSPGPRGTDALPGWPLFDARPVPLADRALLNAQHPYLEWGPDRVNIPAGTHEVRESLVVPEGFEVVVAPGATLRFAPGAALVVQGSLRCEGSADAPVRFAPRDAAAGWQGILVRGEGVSAWTYTEVRGTTGVRSGDWSLTGGVTFSGGEVRLTDCAFTDSRAEDALNIVRARFTCEGVRISDAASDGLDADFADGTWTAGLLERIGARGGGDAIDVSGATVKIVGARFAQIQDKAISAGEGSRVDASRLDLADVGAGAVAKDGSILEVRDSKISGARVAALMAYTKKAELGGATLIAERIAITDTQTPIRVQTGSHATLDGREVPAEPLDVDALYRTSMRKGEGPK